MKQKLKLVLPNKKYLKSYQKFCRDFIKNSPTKKYREGYAKQLASSQNPLFLKWLRDDSKGINLEKGTVAMTSYWAIVNDHVVGRINFRHKLTSVLRQRGGHIGYAVKPSAQRKGYATEMLRQILPKVKSTGIKTVFIDCDSDNSGSRKVIENNGGKFKKESIFKGTPIRLYRIKL